MTNSEQNDLEKLLKDNLSDKAAFVPDFVWDRIEEEIYPQKKRRGFFWLFFCGLGLIAGIAAVYFAFQPGKRTASHTSLAHSVGENDETRNGSNASINRKLIANPRSSTQETQTQKSTDNTSAATVESQATIQSQSPGNTNSGLKISRKKVHSSGSKSKILTPNIQTQPGNILTGNGKGGSISSGSSPKKEPENTTDQTTAKTVENSEPEKADSSKAIADEKSPENPDSLAETLATNEPAKLDSVKASSRRPKFAIGLYGGASLYDMAVFKDYFTSGQLSNRTFKSSGFEIGTGFTYQLTGKLGIYANVAFNRKETSFNYDLAITESDYFNHLLLGELLPIETIIDDGNGNCFLAKNVKADYQVDSWMFSLGTAYEVLKWKKFSLAADVRFSANLNSALQMNELTILEIQDYKNERFNYLKVGAGLNLDYHFSRNMSIGISPMYYWQFNSDKQSFYVGKLKELVLPLRFRVFI